MNSYFVNRTIATWQCITFGTKFVILSSILVYLIDLLLDDMLFELFEDIPAQLMVGQVWRLLLPQFFHGYIYNLVISLFCFYFSAVEFEKMYGTVPFFYDIFFKSIIIQIVYVGICLLISLIYPLILQESSFGFWSLTMVYMTNKALSNYAEPSKFLCIPLSIQARYYPIMFFVIMNIVEFPRIDLIAAIVVALIEYHFFNRFLMKPSKSTINILEQSILFRVYQSRQDFITCDQVNHAFIFNEYSTNYSLEIQDMPTDKVESKEISQQEQEL